MGINSQLLVLCDEQVSVGVGSDTVDVEVRPVKTMRSFAVEAKPNTIQRGYQTEKGYMKDIGIGTMKEPQAHKGTNTQPVTTFPAATNTDEVKKNNTGTDTELKIFQAMEQVKNAGSNTPVVQKYNFGVNTDVIEEPKIVTHDRAIMTQKDFTFNRAVNTDPPRLIHTGVGNQDVHKKLEPERPPVRHASVGIRPNLADRGTGDGIISHSDVYPQDEVQQVQESVVQAQKVMTTRASRSRYGYNENDNNNLARFGLEREEDRATTSSSPSTDSGRSGYTVETRTTRSYGMGPGRTETRTTRTYGTGIEPVTKTTTEVVKKSSGYGTSSPAAAADDDDDTGGGYLSRYGSRPSGGGYSSRTTTTTTTTKRSTGYQDDPDGDGSSSQTVVTKTTSRGSPGRGSWRTTEVESSSGDGGGEQEVEWVTDAAGNTKMRVIRSVETTYVGEKPVHQSSNVVIQDDGSGVSGDDAISGAGSASSTRRVMKSDHEFPERDSTSPGSFRRVTKSPSGGQTQQEYSMTSSTSPPSQRLHGRTVTTTETRIERRADGTEVGDNGKSIKSILKEPGSQSPNIRKKEIKFAEGTVGG